jgi:hypothetical protein
MYQVWVAAGQLQQHNIGAVKAILLTHFEQQRQHHFAW